MRTWAAATRSTHHLCGSVVQLCVDIHASARCVGQSKSLLARFARANKGQRRPGQGRPAASQLGATAARTNERKPCLARVKLKPCTGRRRPGPCPFGLGDSRTQQPRALEGCCCRRGGFDHTNTGRTSMQQARSGWAAASHRHIRIRYDTTAVAASRRPALDGGAPGVTTTPRPSRAAGFFQEDTRSWSGAVPLVPWTSYPREARRESRDLFVGSPCAVCAESDATRVRCARGRGRTSWFLEHACCPWSLIANAPKKRSPMAAASAAS